MADDWSIDAGGRLAAGAMVGPYRVEAPLGEGGMGTVYRAMDTKLNRPVAIKILSDDFADAAARRRFQREAQTASSLNHPHILTVYDAGEHEGRQYLVTEFVDGGTLKDWATAEKRTWRQAVELMIGVADGLAAAHAAGITHRDVKPPNILISKSGYAKLADFGLAKLEETSDPDATRTLAEGYTRPGTIIGTIAYMSPEQASGQRLDARSDVFSFGVVLYELLAGRKPFQGRGDLELLKTVIEKAPEPLPETIPPALANVVEKALEKDPAARYQSTRDLVVDLRRTLRSRTESDSAVVQVASPRSGFRLAIIAATAAILGAVATAWYLAGRSGAPTQEVRVQRLTDAVGLEEAPALSPDGKAVAYAAASGGRRQIWVRLLTGGTPLQITKDDAEHFGPRWAPDSASLIYYTVKPGEQGAIWEVAALGGTPRRMVNALGPGDLSPDGKRLAYFVLQEGTPELVIASRDLLAVESAKKLDPVHVPELPRWSPDGRQIAFKQRRRLLFAHSLVIAEVSGGELRELPQPAWIGGVAWTPDGSALIVSSSQGSTMVYPPTLNLWAIRADTGAARQLTFGEASYESVDLDPRGNLVTDRVRSQSDIWKLPVTGTPESNSQGGVRITRQTGQVQTPALSPDESEVAFLSDNGGHSNVWVARVADGETRAITREFDPKVALTVPSWSTSGEWINFLSNRNSGGKGVTLWMAKPDGSDVRDTGNAGAWVCWPGDGRWVYYSVDVGSKFRIYKMPTGGGDPVVVREDNAIGCAMAPDGSALYYITASEFEIRVAKPENGPSQVLGRISPDRIPVTAVYAQVYLSPDGELLAIPLADGATTNIWALPTHGGEWRKLTEFSPRNVRIVRKIAWSRDSKSIYAAVADVDSDLVMLTGLTW